jgi:hypothetical protein
MKGILVLRLQGCFHACSTFRTVGFDVVSHTHSTMDGCSNQSEDGDYIIPFLLHRCTLQLLLRLSNTMYFIFACCTGHMHCKTMAITTHSLQSMTIEQKEALGFVAVSQSWRVHSEADASIKT